MTKNFSDNEIQAALKLIASIGPEDVDLNNNSLLYTEIRKNYEIARTAEFVRENYNVTDEESFSIASDVRERMDNCEYDNYAEGEFIAEVCNKRGIK